MSIRNLFGKQDLKKQDNNKDTSTKDVTKINAEVASKTSAGNPQLAPGGQLQGNFPPKEEISIQEDISGRDISIADKNENDQLKKGDALQTDETDTLVKPIKTVPSDEISLSGRGINGENEQIHPQKCNDVDDCEKNTKSPSGNLKTTADTAPSEAISFSEKNKRYIIGDVAGTFFQTPFSAKKSDQGSFHRNDIVADIAKINNLLVMGASLRGESHYAHRIPRQDSFLIEECIVNDINKFVIAAIADGVGNAKKSDEFSEMLVNFLCGEVSNELRHKQELKKIDWNRLAESIWKISVNYCYQKLGSKNIDDYFQYWASTLECVVVEAQSANKVNFVAVTISGDGGIYKLDVSHNWNPIKHGKTGNNTAVSNLVYCLPDKPVNIIIKYGSLSKGEAIFLVTDGLSDYIEEYDDVRQFFGRFLPNFANLPEFVRVLNVAVKQMDDDKTGVLIIYSEDLS